MQPANQFNLLKDVKLPLVIALMGFIGAISGTVLGSYLTAKHAREKDIAELRMAMYNKFFAGQAKLLQIRYSHLPAEQAEELHRQYQQEIKEARFQIGVFATPEVIRALNAWFNMIENPKKDDPDPWTQDVKSYQAIRREILGDQAGQIDDAVLYDLLFKYGNALPPGPK
jgi:hypothetical protein